MRAGYWIIIVALIACGCKKTNKIFTSDNRVAQVTSNTSWSGYFHNRSVDGNGNATVDMPDDGTACAVVQKNTEGGTLTLTLTGRTAVTTTAKYGIVDDCLE